jgi:hypothetical protein
MSIFLSKESSVGVHMVSMRGVLALSLLRTSKDFQS